MPDADQEALPKWLEPSPGNISGMKEAKEEKQPLNFTMRSVND